MDLDSTVVLTALITGGLTYLAAWRSGKVELRRVEADNERLREQHREDHLRNRQGTYHQFLTVDRRFALTLTGHRQPLEGEDVQTMYDTWIHVSNGVLLFGAPSVRAAVNGLREKIAAVAGVLKGETADSIYDAFRAADAEIEAAREAVLEAMRSDVAPDSRDT